MSFERKGAQGACHLVVRGNRREILDERQAEILSAAENRHLVHLLETAIRIGRTTLRYDITDLVRLEDVVRKKPITSRMLLGFVHDLLEVIEWCTRMHVSSLQLLLDQRNVYAGVDGSLRFICVPLQEFGARHRGTPLGLVTYLSQGSPVRYADAEATSLAARLRNCVTRANGVFSAMDLRSLLREELGEESSVSVELNAASESTALTLLAGREYLVGRAAGCDLRLCANKLVSREHARVRAVAGGVMIRDLKSTNGTMANGAELDPQREAFVPVGESFFVAGEKICVGEGGYDAARNSHLSAGARRY